MKGLLSKISLKNTQLPLLLLLVLSLITSSGLSVLFSTNSSAASTYDDTISTVDTLKLQHPTNPNCTTQQTLTYTWPEIFSSTEGTFSGVLGDSNPNFSWKQSSGVEASYTATKELWDNKERWGVTQINESTNSYQAQVWFTNDPNAYISFHTAAPGYTHARVNINSGYNMRFIHLTYNYNAGDITTGCNVTVSIVADTPMLDVSWSPSYNYPGAGILFAYADVVYPDGYEGTEIPDSVATPGEKLRPNITIDVMDKNVSINSKVNDDVFNEIGEYKVYWFITNSTFDGEGSSCEPAFSTSGYSLPDTPLNFEAPCYGTYSINAYFSYFNGEYPIDDFGDWSIVETTINVDINGSYFSIDTDADEFVCNEVNYCEYPSEAWEDEPCDLLNIGGCVNNVLHYLMEWLGILPNQKNPTGSPFVAFQTEMHGVTAVITAPLFIFQNLATSEYTCNPVVLPLPNVGNLTLPCLYGFYQTTFGTMFFMYQTIVSGIISYYICVSILRITKEAKDPKKDRIEVAKL